MSNLPEQDTETTQLEGKTVRQRWIRRLIEPTGMFIAIALLVLALIWSPTLNLIAKERAAAEQAASSAAADLADIYEAQALRALREIDQALKLVRFGLSSAGPEETLSNLDSKSLLPPAILFSIGITNAHGEVIASNHLILGEEDVSGHDYFRQSMRADDLIIGLPRYDDTSGEWRLHFSRRIDGNDGSFAGIVMLSVHVGYFVSGYEERTMGEYGVLGLVGTDGIFRARRTGEKVVAGDWVDYGALVQESDFGESESRLENNSWDGMRRYTVARKLFEFPLAIMVGLSRAEHLAEANLLVQKYILRASAISVFLLAVLILLNRLSTQLQRSQERVAEERIAHARRVEFLAYYDSLTNLPNRAFFSQLLSQEMQKARRYDRRLALLFLDLDRFKNVNDSFGHESGDVFLQEVGRRLQDAVRESDVVARLGGDEFVVMLPEILSSVQIAPVAEKILSKVSRPFTLTGREFRMTVSIGISLFPDDGEEEQTLMKNADVAMYHAKEHGRDNYQYYSDKLNTDSLQRLALESSLRGALEREEFRLFFQGKLDVRSDRLMGVEALLRWQQPDIGMISPMQFIPLAEETGLIVPIGRWVLRTACQQCVAWQKDGHGSLNMAVNLSPRQFLDDNLLDDITNIIEETGMEPQRLELEITESMLMHDLDRTIQILWSLKDMGIRVAIDDFGTGYSSLSILKKIPLDIIKIDKSFVYDVESSSEGMNLTKAVIAIGKGLGLTVIAEGVETASQADFLRSHACDQFQGYFINKPMPAEDFIRFISEQRN